MPSRREPGSDSDARLDGAWGKFSAQVPRDLEKVYKAELRLEDRSARGILSAAMAIFLGAPEPVRREMVRWVHHMDTAGVLNREVTPEGGWRYFQYVMQRTAADPDWTPNISTDRMMTEESPPESNHGSGERPSKRRESA